MQPKTLSKRNLVLACMGLALAATIGAGVARALYAAAKLRTTEQGVSADIAVNWPNLDLEGRKLAVLIGDSRIALWVPPPNLPGMAIANRGLGGDTTAGILRRLSSDTWPARPAVFIIQAGMNDIVAAGLNPDQRDKIKVKAIENLRKLAKTAEQRGDKVIFMTIIEPADVRLRKLLFWSGSIPQLVAEVNDAIKGFDSPKTRVLDTAAALKNRDGSWKLGMTIDELHLSELGYAELNKAVTGLLEQD